MKHLLSRLYSLVLVAALLLGSITPIAAQSGSAYTVQPGDTLFSISRRYGVPVTTLASANGLGWNSWIYIGQTIVIPGTSAPSPAPAPPATGSVYVVQAGDTLIGIAMRYGVSASQLAGANGLAWSSWVYAGQRLVIPGNSPNTPAPAPVTGDSTYTVAAGNTLFSIARQYGTTVDSLRRVNGLASNTIYVGQQLKLSGAGSTTPPATSQPSVPVGNAAGKWIDVNLSAQTLTAYQDQSPVYTAIVSTGTWQYPTVTGTYAVYAKYPSTRMSGGSGASYYDLPNVPYTMYFYRGYAIHGTYWHNNFGTPMSHGCVNLTIPDSEWVYNWAPMGTTVVVHY